MKPIPRGSWQYGVGLIVLFSLAALATSRVIHSVDLLIAQEEYEMARRVSLLGTWFLTMGFMFLAAGLGMWAIKYASYRESIRRLGTFISAMDYLRDGLVALDSKGRIVSTNPAARTLASGDCDSLTPLQSAFPCLSADDVDALIAAVGPYEIEREVMSEQAMRNLRFRSLATVDLPMVLVSDVTERVSQERRRREMARLQLIGRISRGVADDFNRILSIISGQTGLLNRCCEGHEGARQATNEIYRAIQSGSSLATHLLDLSRADAPETPTDYVEQPLRSAVELLRLTLPPGWKVIADIGRNLPAVTLSGSQVEQSVMNLGLMCSDLLSVPGTVRISARVPSDNHLDAVGRRFALIIIVSATPADDDQLLDVPGARTDFQSIADEAGAVLTVVRSAIEASGGRLDGMRGEQGMQMFRIALPMGCQTAAKEGKASFSDEALRSRLSNKTILLAVAGGRGDELEKTAQALDMRVLRVVNTVSLLANIEDSAFDTVLLDRRLIDPEATAMIRAVGKLRPNLRLLVLGDKPRYAAADVPSGVRFFPAAASPRALFEAVAGLE